MTSEPGPSALAARLAPVLAVLVISSLTMGAVILLQSLAQVDLFLINKAHLGFDYGEFYAASQLLRAGGDPYTLPRYVTPPLPALLNLPATWLSLGEATRVAAFATLLAVVLSLAVPQRVFFRPQLRDEALFLLSATGVVVLSYPFWFLFDRGNIDGFVLLFVCLGAVALGKSDAAAGVLFALAAGCKLYPALVVVPLAARRRWTALAAMAASGLVFWLLTPRLWAAFFSERLFTRVNQFRIDENGSLAATLHAVGSFLSRSSPWTPAPLADVLRGLSLPLYVVLVALVALHDARSEARGERRELCASVLSYLPFMVAVPQLSYHYELVCVLGVLPAVAWYWSRASAPRTRFILALVVLGIGLSQFQAVAVHKLTFRVYAQFVPGLGLLLVMLGIVALRWEQALPAWLGPRRTPS